jgi:2-polyprenyl-3-methyl-5-hydroxy-6-metoxy-1,4-benzoquinol methylase
MTRPNHSNSSPAPRPESDAETIYDADYYDRQLHRHHWFHNNAAKRELRWQEVLRMLEPSVDDRVLEIGCATGDHVLRLARLCREVVGIDNSTAAIERAEARCVTEEIAAARFMCLDASNLDQLRNASFDKIAAIDFVEHVEDEALLIILQNCHRLLRPRGRLAIFTPCASHYVERLKAHNVILKQLPGHVAVRGPYAYRRLLSLAGFAIDSLYFSPSTYPLFGSLDRWLANARIVGPLFRFRICIVARPGNRL